MKNKIFNTLLGMLTIIVMVGCDDDSTAGYTRITYYPEINILGNTMTAVELGSTYVDAGIEVFENGEDVTDKAVVNSNVDTSQVGVYTVRYSATNVDGFSASATRTVVVYTGTVSTTDLSGTYTSDTKVNSDGSISTAYSGGRVVVTRAGDGIFHLSCLLGSWYAVRYPTMSGVMNTPGFIQVHEDNTISIYPATQPYWGNPVTDEGVGYYDPETGHIHITTLFSGMQFICDMSK